MFKNCNLFFILDTSLLDAMLLCMNLNGMFESSAKVYPVNHYHNISQMKPKNIDINETKKIKKDVSERSTKMDVYKV